MKTTVRLWKPALRAQRRAFSSTSRRLDSYAFIGLGQMVGLFDSAPPSLTSKLTGGVFVRVGVSDGAQSPVEATAQ
jgi:hypothetical protein